MKKRKSLKPTNQSTATRKVERFSPSVLLRQFYSAQSAQSYHILDFSSSVGEGTFYNLTKNRREIFKCRGHSLYQKGLKNNESWKNNLLLRLSSCVPPSRPLKHSHCPKFSVLLDPYIKTTMMTVGYSCTKRINFHICWNQRNLSGFARFIKTVYLSLAKIATQKKLFV